MVHQGRALNRHVMYDSLLMFTLLVMLVEVGYLFEPFCPPNSALTFESTRDASSAEVSTGHLENDLGNDPKAGHSAVATKNEDAHVGTRKGRDKPKPIPRSNGEGAARIGIVPKKQRTAHSQGDAKLNAESRAQRAGAGAVRKVSEPEALGDVKNLSAPSLGQGQKVPGMPGGNKRGQTNKERSGLVPRNQTKERSPISRNETRKTSANKRAPSACRRTILIYGSIKVIRQWKELRTLVEALQPLDNGDWSTETMCGACAVQLTLSDRTDSVRGKDAVVLGVSPYSLKVKLSTFKDLDFDPTQLLVFYGVETPLRLRKWIPTLGTLPIHVVWSYSPSTAVHMPYGFYRPSEPMSSLSNTAEQPGSTERQLVAWMASNCEKEVFWPRMDFVRQLQAHISVDVYGKCGNMTCLPRLSDRCQALAGRYKFYLALENAECDDYVTEKFWETALGHGAVPVVYGAPRAFYTRTAPPNSFIYAGDFTTAKELAEFLTDLAGDPVRYGRYLEWRRKGTAVANYPELRLGHFCRILPHIKAVVRGRLRRRRLDETTWFNSCRRMRKGQGAFLPANLNRTQWVPW